MMIAGVGGSVYTAITIYETTNGNLEKIFEENYTDSTSFKREFEDVVYQLALLIDFYKSEEHILAGETLDNDPFEEVTDEMREELIADQMRYYQLTLNNIGKREGLIYYATDGEHIFTNTNQTDKTRFKQHPAYYISEDFDVELYPVDFGQTYSTSDFIHRTNNPINTKIYVAYPDTYLSSISSDWAATRAEISSQINYLLVFISMIFVGFIYLVVTTGRHSLNDKRVHMRWFDKFYVDLNVIVCFLVTLFWVFIVEDMIYFGGSEKFGLTAITMLLAAILMTLFLSLVKHMKNKTIFKHTLLYTVWRALYRMAKDTYDSGSLGVKIVVVVILYPIITVVSVVLFPITIGVAVWLALRQVKSFQKIQEGVELMKEGNLQYQIELDGKGEFAELASNINGINQNFKQAVHNELKNERMKTELITNVSHDIRTPLTSLITYTDLLKTETDPDKIQEYVEILDQKSKRLKVLTDDLFSAAKASSGDIPVDLQQIDVVALVNQGIGEVSEQIAEKNFTFKLSHSAENMYVVADGKLLWRSIENILSNIFNYGLEGSRVYIDITRESDQTLISFKNISKYELNITEAELMERFKRGDESRTSKGSGLGLSITKSLIENQNGKFEINIDGDLFKSMIYLPNGENAEISEESF